MGTEIAFNNYKDHMTSFRAMGNPIMCLYVNMGQHTAFSLTIKSDFVCSVECKFKTN